MNHAPSSYVRSRESDREAIYTAGSLREEEAMADPLHDLRLRLQAALALALGEEYANTNPILHRSDRADSQADVAMSLAKKLQRSPREVAQSIIDHLDLSGICKEVAVAGPGFINLTLDDRFLASLTMRGFHAEDSRPVAALVDKPDTVVIDYSSPNVAKEMHVGNIRSTIIGDALARVLEFLGHRVVRQNHIGDWGTPFGMLIEHLKDLGEDGDTASALSIGDLNAFYREARSKFDGAPEFAERARSRVVLLQSGDNATLALWKQLVDQSTRYFDLVYRRLGVTLSERDICGESHYNPLLNEIVTELESKGLLQLSEGALCAFPDGFRGKTGEPLPLIVRKQDGGYGYATTDLAAIRHRIRTLGGTRLLYVVGAPQQQHLAMVFSVASAAQWLTPNTRAEHVSFGSVLGADKKMFKTRSGDTVKLIELIDEAVQRAVAVLAEKNPDLDDEERREVARKIGVGAIKYADLSSDRAKDYIFDWDRMLAFEGNTAPYLQYVHARIQSIFRRADCAELSTAPAPQSFTHQIEADGALVITETAERALALTLIGFGDAVVSVSTSLQPHRLCTYLYELATRFTTFYQQCPVLRADDERTRRSRLLLCQFTASTLKQGLELLGIEAPDRM
ncbi:MAG: arginine--tRNA ligase [Polyangiales bacterium]